MMKGNTKTRSKRVEDKPKKTSWSSAEQEAVRRCFLCGDKNHLISKCLTKSKGVKCFKCREYGHIVPECGTTSKATKDVCSASEVSRTKRCAIEAQIGDCKLVDSGSDLTIMRADQYVKVGAPKLGNRSIG